MQLENSVFKADLKTHLLTTIMLQKFLKFNLFSASSTSAIPKLLHTTARFNVRQYFGTVVKTVVFPRHKKKHESTVCRFETLLAVAC